MSNYPQRPEPPKQGSGNNNNYPPGNPQNAPGPQRPQAPDMRQPQSPGMPPQGYPQQPAPGYQQGAPKYQPQPAPVYHQPNYAQTSAPQPPAKEKQSNIMGMLGFICSILAYLLSFIGGQLLFWPLGLVFSCIGLFKKPRLWAISGLSLSVLYVVLFIFIFTVLASIGGPIFGLLAAFLTPEFLLPLLALLGYGIF